MGQTTKVVFLDVCLMSLNPLITCVHCKDTHACQCITWDSNVPRHTRVAWVRGEFIRLIRICSHQHLYQVCCSRLVSALRWLNYPWEVIQSKRIPRGERNRFRTLRHDVVPSRVANEPMSLSQSEMMSSRHNGVMGGVREPFGQVHGFCPPPPQYQTCAPPPTSEQGGAEPMRETRHPQPIVNPHGLVKGGLG